MILSVLRNLPDHRTFHVAFSVVLMLCGQSGVSHARANGQHDESLPLRSADVTSPSIGFRLQVTPEEDRPFRHLYGAEYRFFERGRQLWSATLPYLLRRVIVTDSGYVIGCARTVDSFDWSANPHTSLHVVIIDKTGKELLNEVHEQRRDPVLASTYPPTARRPEARQMIVDTDTEHLLVRVVEPADRDTDRFFCGTDAWWVYVISTGQRVGRFETQDLVRDYPLSFVADAAVVRGANLLLVHYVLLSKSSDVPRSARFALIDGKSTPVWSLDLLDEYATLPEGQAYSRDDLEDLVRAEPAIRASTEPLQFRIHSRKENELMCFRVERDRGDTWAVRKIECKSASDQPVRRAE